MRAYSKKRAKENRLYLPLRTAFLEAHPICQSCSSARSMDVDHITNRSQSSAAFLDQANWRAVCRMCHDDKGRNVQAAIDAGLAVPGWQYRQNLESEQM